MSTNLMTASREWATRPDDQRYLSLDDLHSAVSQRRRESWTATPDTKELRVLPTRDNDLYVRVYDPTHGDNRLLKPSNFSFGQLSQYAGAPAAYLRKLPAELAAINLQWGLENAPVRNDALVLGHSNGDDRLRAMTSTSYGRIWDHQVVEAVKKANPDGRFVIPAASYATTNPKRATTLYASDRDVFIFLVDPKNPIEIPAHDGKPAEQLFRGFYTWNSEVGAATFGLCGFLYRFVCDNRTIWGATEVRELRIRHTGGAPDRFAYEGSKYLLKYANESAAKTIEGIKLAQNREIPINEGKGETVESWLQKRGFTKAAAKASVETAQAEQGSTRSVWDVVNGITAYARSISHTDTRVELETKAGKLMEEVSKAG